MGNHRRKEEILEHLQSRTASDVSETLLRLKEIAEEQVARDRASARRLAEQLVPEQIDALSQQDPTILERMTTEDYHQLIAEHILPVRALLDLGTTGRVNIQSQIIDKEHEISRLRRALQETQAALEAAQERLRSPSTQPSASRSPASRPPGSADGAIQLSLNAADETFPVLQRIAGGEHRQAIFHDEAASALEAAATQGLIKQYTVARPDLVYLLDLTPAGRERLTSAGLPVPECSLFNMLLERKLPLEAIHVVLWAVPALAEVDLSPRRIGDLPIAFSFGEMPVVVGCPGLMPTAVQLLRVLQETGGTLYMLAVDGDSQRELLTQATLAADDYNRPCTLCLTNTRSLIEHKLSKDNSIWVFSRTLGQTETR
jgi:hypothetical protein